MSTGFSSSASVCPTTHEAILIAIVQKLRTDIGELGNESCCFLSDSPSPGIEIQEDLFCTVAPIDDTFDDQAPIGAAERGIVEVALVQVTVWSRLMLDRLEHSSQSLTDSSRGLLKFKQRSLQSLAGRQIYADAPLNLVPLLMEPLRPVRALHPTSRRGADDLRSVSLIFRAVFNWDLSIDS
ncbi:MAG: hypothetical protein JSS49_19035 [Planctomycetes bacterium]|nr:hypothetical protein [Planctomycetota bacterium]